MSLEKLEERLSEAVSEFWRKRAEQQSKGGGDDTAQYAGTRGSVVGGGHLNGFIRLMRALLMEGGLPEACIYQQSGSSILPGFFRPTKAWDLIVVSEGSLIATIEFKSHVGSFGNNWNNRVEEALGNAVDFHRAFKDGAFSPSPLPWLGYLMLLEHSAASTRPIRVKEPHFKVLKEWRDVSYEQRYKLFCTKLVRERLYDAACLLTSSKAEGKKGIYNEPSVEVGFRNFAALLVGRIAGIARTRS